MKRRLFEEIQPGEQFSRTDDDSAPKYVRLANWVLTCIPNEDIGSDYYNAASLKDGDLEEFDNMETVFTKV